MAASTTCGEIIDLVGPFGTASSESIIDLVHCPALGHDDIIDLVTPATSSQGTGRPVQHAEDSSADSNSERKRRLFELNVENVNHNLANYPGTLPSAGDCKGALGQPRTAVECPRSTHLRHFKVKAEPLSLAAGASKRSLCKEGPQYAQRRAPGGNALSSLTQHAPATTSQQPPWQLGAPATTSTRADCRNQVVGPAHQDISPGAARVGCSKQQHLLGTHSGGHTRHDWIDTPKTAAPCQGQRAQHTVQQGFAGQQQQCHGMDPSSRAGQHTPRVEVMPLEASLPPLSAAAVAMAPSPQEQPCRSPPPSQGLHPRAVPDALSTGTSMPQLPAPTACAAAGQAAHVLASACSAGCELGDAGHSRDLGQRPTPLREAALCAAPPASEAAVDALPPSHAAVHCPQQGEGGPGVPAEAPPPPGPDPSNIPSMLQHLRAQIPQNVLQRYGPQQAVDPQDKAAADARLERYAQQLAEVFARQECKIKQDMRAVKYLRRDHPAWPVWTPTHGHPPGIQVGRVFGGRCELMAAGVHGNFMRGISSSGNGAPAYAVCLSGGYEDTDHGDWLVYTGEGPEGQQQWETGGNRGLREALEQQQPVRVARIVKGSGTGQQYSYDGLYCIVNARQEQVPGRGVVCKFWMVGLPGHYNTAARKVPFLARRGVRPMQLATRPVPSPCKNRQPQPSAAPHPGATHSRSSEGAAGAPRSAGKQAPGRRKAPALRQRLLLHDISGGLEAVQIPVYNEVDQDPPPTNFTYLRSSLISDPAAQPLHAAAAALMPAGGRWCGLQQGQRPACPSSRCFYFHTGQLRSTVEYGLWECCGGCGSQPQCRHNRVVTRGLSLPLEVFKAEGKGWGLRCAEPIPVGSFVCSYEGEMLASDTGDLRGDDTYFFDLDYFLQLHADATLGPREVALLPPLPPGHDPDCGQHLMIDALKQGNVARFINHSCDPNLVVQVVVGEGGSAFVYSVALFASRDIPAREELGYDYKYKVGGLPGRELHCRCGARNCKGRLL